MIKRTKTSAFGVNALVWREGSWFVAKAIEVEIASQGKTAKQALDNLQEALELYFEDENVPAASIHHYTDLQLETLFPKIGYA